MNQTNPSILLTIDVEDWFQVENFKDCIPSSSWDSCELRVERNTHRLLDLFDSVGIQPQAKRSSSEAVLDQSDPRAKRSSNTPDLRATFFVLGWIAERLPNLIREIHARGHEVASHGYNHCLCNECSLEELRQDLTDSRKNLEDLIGAPVLGYRAPSFSISNDILKIIQDSGYLYDSSYNSFGLHGRYGKINLNANAKNGIAYQIPVNSSGESALEKSVKRHYFFELPISNLQFNIQHSTFKIKNLILPWGGGGYFRLTPFFAFKMGVESILKKDHTYLFYCHPWEIDPEQPKVKTAPLSYKFRHYINLKKTHSRLTKLISTFQDYRFMTCRQYIDELR
ncbi:MAG: DUF3473 domain-containing protein [Candidatus Aminicenantes bacterium]|nr:DUF3473 domain-containing protein [Candidatus Aminicenantes bacterium]